MNRRCILVYIDPLLVSLLIKKSNSGDAVLHGAEDVGLAPGDAGHLLAVEVRHRVAERHLVTNKESEDV